MNNQIDSNVLDRLRLEMLSSQESFTRAMFKAQYKRSFIVSEHHKRIFEALQDVVDGKCTRLIINMPPRYGKTETAIKQAEEDYFIAQEKYKAGEGIMLDIIDAQEALSTARQNYISAQYDYARYKAALEADMGGTNEPAPIDN